jgi:hypothetical protein
MFDSEVFGRHEVVVDVLRQPLDRSRGAIVDLIRSKWPLELRPRLRRDAVGCDPPWFEKWSFE